MQSALCPGGTNHTEFDMNGSTPPLHVESRVAAPSLFFSVNYFSFYEAGNGHCSCF